jgi:hypothetical protein
MRQQWVNDFSAAVAADVDCRAIHLYAHAHVDSHVSDYYCYYYCRSFLLLPLVLHRRRLLGANHHHCVRTPEPSSPESHEGFESSQQSP